MNAECRNATLGFILFCIQHSTFSIKNNELWTGYKH